MSITWQEINKNLYDDLRKYLFQFIDFDVYKVKQKIHYSNSKLIFSILQLQL